VDGFSTSQKLTDLVSLKMSNHVPVNFLRQSGIVGILLYKRFDIVGGEFEMLDPVFTQFGAAETNNLFNRVEICGFCYNDQSYLGNISMAACADRGNAVTNLLQIVGNFAHRKYPTEIITAGILPDF
jgi:hypothetical protein